MLQRNIMQPKPTPNRHYLDEDDDLRPALVHLAGVAVGEEALDVQVPVAHHDPLQKKSPKKKPTKKAAAFDKMLSVFTKNILNEII